MWDQVKTKTIDVENTDKKIVNNKLYFIEVINGIGKKPSIVDSTYVTYQGMLLNGNLFDNREYPIWFDLTSVVRGFQHSLSEFSEGDYIINSDGTYEFQNYGKGIIFFPSTLGYYSNINSNIPAYSPLIFTINLHLVKRSDHDGDGILSINEDINNDGNPLNDDSDGDGIANMNDFDDDNDGIPTFDEYDKDNNGLPDDSDNDGIPDYLDNI